MSDTRTNAPKIRFKGYTEDWEQRKFRDILKTNSFRAYLADGSENGNYEVIQQGDKPVIGYADGEPFADYEDVTLFGDHTVSLYKPNRPFFVATDGMKILSADNLKGDYLYTTLERYKPESQGYKRHFTILKNQDVWFTENQEEQVEIGSFFSNFDTLIAHHQRELDLLKQTKQTYLQKMFPKSGENMPEIRFAGFTNTWEQRKLGDLVDLVIRGVSKPDEPYYRMSVRSHAKGTFRQFVSDPDSVAMDKLFVVRKDDLVVNITFAWEHAIAVVPEENDGLLVSHRFPTYRADGKSDIKFLHYIVSKEEFRRKLEFISPGGAGRNRVLNKKDFLKLKMYVPKLDEQKQIGNFFKKLDDTITLHQRKLNTLKEMKKSLLQQMFV